MTRVWYIYSKSSNSAHFCPLPQKKHSLYEFPLCEFEDLLENCTFWIFSPIKNDGKNPNMYNWNMLCCSWLQLTKLNFFHNEFCFVAWKSHPSLDKVNSTATTCSHDFFVVSSQQIQNEEIYSNNMEKMSKCLKLHVQLDQKLTSKAVAPDQ